MVIWYNSPIPVHLVRWFLECQRSLLPFPVWPLPICLDSWTWHFRFLGNIALYSIRPCFYHQPHPQLGIVFALAPSLHSFWSYFPLISSSILGTYQPGEFIFQCPIFLPYHTVHGFSRQEYWSFCHSLLQLTTFCQNSPPWPICLGWPYMAWFTVSLC